MTNTEELQKVLDKLNVIADDFTEMKQEIKEVRIEIGGLKEDIGTLKIGQAVMANDSKWIKILYGVFSSIIAVLLATLIQFRA